MTSPLDPDDLFDVPDPFAASGSPAAPPTPPDVDAWPSSPTRARTRAIRVAAVVGAVACEALLVSMMGLRSAVARDALLLGVAVALPAATALAVVVAARSQGSHRGRVAVTLVASLVVFAITTGITVRGGGDWLDETLECIMGTSLMAFGPALLAILAMRRAFVAGATLRTAALGIGAGLLGAAATRLYCPNDVFGHVMVGHGSPILLAAVLAALLGTRLTRA